MPKYLLSTRQFFIAENYKRRFKMKKLLLGFVLVVLNLLSFGTAHAWHAEGYILCTDQEPIVGAVVTVECDGSIYSVVESTAEGYYAIEFPHEPVVCTLSVDVSGKIDEPISILEPADAVVDNGVGSIVRVSGTHFINWLFDSPSCIITTTTSTIPATTTTTIVSPLAYCKDFLEQGNPGGWNGSLKTFDDEWALSPSGTVDMDIWLNDVPEPMLTSGCYITYDPELITITNFVPNDTTIGGQWDGGFTTLIEVESGIWFLALANFGCVEPDVDGDIFLTRATFQRQALGTVAVTIQTIPGFDTLVGCSALNYDPQIPPNTIIINDGITASGCFGNFDNDSDVDGTDAGIFKLSFGRSTYNNPCEGENPCNGDFDCDADVDGTDSYGFKAEFGRCEFDNPCPSNVATVECTY